MYSSGLCWDKLSERREAMEKLRRSWERASIRPRPDYKILWQICGTLSQRSSSINKTNNKKIIGNAANIHTHTHTCIFCYDSGQNRQKPKNSLYAFYSGDGLRNHKNICTMRNVNGAISFINFALSIFHLIIFSLN